MKPLAIALFLLFLAVPSFADSITMFNYGTLEGPCCGFFSIQMVPGAEQQLLYTLNWSRPTTDILFRGVVDTAQISSMSWTFNSVDTGSMTITFPSAACSAAPPYYCYGDFQIPTHGSNHGPFLGSLTVSLNGTLTQTYNFQYLIPIPEPTTFLLLGTGLAGIGWRKFRAIGSGER